MLKTFCGWMDIEKNSEGDEVLSIKGEGSKHSQFLIELLQDYQLKYGSYISLRYWYCDKPFKREDANEMAFLTAASRVKYNIVYSEATGYLWTTEEFEIGGHDMVKIWKSLCASASIYIIIEIDFSLYVTKAPYIN
jgi:hypothetical protein